MYELIASVDYKYNDLFIEPDKEYIYLFIKVPEHTESVYNYAYIMDNILDSTVVDSILSMELCREYYHVLISIKIDINIKTLLEKLNDIYKNNSKFRFLLQIQTNIYPYPSYIYTNKRGRLIIVKQKKRLLSLM